MVERDLKYELEKLEIIIANELFLDQETKEHPMPEDRKDFRQLLTDEVERVKKKFAHEIFAFEDEHHLERYIQFHQQELIRLADVIGKVKKPTTKAEFAFDSPLRMQACIFIEDLLSFIERHFTKYFDQDTKAPESYIALAGSEVVKGLGELQDLLKNENTDNNLVDLVLDPLKKFIECIPGNQITYRKIIYVKDIHKEITQGISSRPKRTSVDDEIRTVLLYLNFNTINYFRYYTDYINKQVSQTESSSDKIEKFSFILKMINQTQVKPGVAYNHTVRSLRDQVSDWVGEEIFYLEKMHKLNEKHAVSTGLVSEEFKVRTDMSVSQIAYLLRVFLETKIVSNKNISELIRFFSRFFQTKRMENISYESFRVRYYNTEDGTKKSVRSMLLLMVDYINKN